VRITKILMMSVTVLTQVAHAVELNMVDYEISIPNPLHPVLLELTTGRTYLLLAVRL
jgi:hypothetical protein